MSSGSSNDNAFVSQPPPAHHVHHDSEVLPGARGAAPAANYDASLTNDSRTWQDNNERQYGAGTDTNAVMAGGQHAAPSTQDNDSNNAFNQDRPLNVQPTSQGGVAIGGHDDLPEGKASVTDKLIGKTQKVTGKVTRNAEMHEKGELREAGGKGAVKGETRAPHD